MRESGPVNINKNVYETHLYVKNLHHEGHCVKNALQTKKSVYYANAIKYLSFDYYSLCAQQLTHTYILLDENVSHYALWLIIK